MPAFDINDRTAAATAFHESGHFVAAVLADLPVESITLCDRHSGIVKRRGWTDPLNLAARSACCSLAGPFAEYFFHRTRGHIFSVAAQVPEREFWRFALDQPERRGQALDLRHVARYVKCRSRRATYQRSRSIYSQVRTALTNPLVWSVVSDVAAAACRRGVLVDADLEPYRARAAALGQRFGFLNL